MGAEATVILTTWYRVVYVGTRAIKVRHTLRRTPGGLFMVSHFVYDGQKAPIAYSRVLSAPDDVAIKRAMANNVRTLVKGLLDAAVHR